MPKTFAPVYSAETAHVSALAVLKSALEGYDLYLDDPDLWQQTGFAGDELLFEDLAAALPRCGLSAVTRWGPIDLLMTPSLSVKLPLIVQAKVQDGEPYFILVWKKVGSFWQVIDPKVGRRWLKTSQLQKILAADKIEYSFDQIKEQYDPQIFATELKKRMESISLSPPIIEQGLSFLTGDWHRVAAIDAAVRLITHLVQVGSVRSGEDADQALIKLFAKDTTELEELIPAAYWTFRQGAQNPQLIAFYGLKVIEITGLAESNEPSAADPRINNAPKPTDWRHFLGEPEKIIWQVLREDGLLSPLSVIVGLLIASIGLTVEMFLLQGLLELGQQLSDSKQRAFMLGAVILFLIALLLLLIALDSIGRQQGRRIEVRLRIAFLEKIPRLPLWFFQRNQVSGLTQRGYTLRSVHSLPDQAQKFIQTCFQILFTAIGLIWLEPSGSWLVLLLVAFTIVWPYFTQPIINQHSLGLAQENNSLSRVYLDVLLGVVPVRVHSAESTVWRRYQGMLVNWVNTNLSYFKVTTVVQIVGLLLSTSLMVGIVLNYVFSNGELGAILLLAFWSINLPVLGQRLVEAMQEYLQKRALVQMLMQPLNIPDAAEFKQELSVTHPPQASPDGVRIELQQVSVTVADQTILKEIDLKIAAGEQIAIVGPSGAGKSTLATLLLGWQSPSAGQLLVDGVPLEGEYIELLRRETAWIDPAVQLWNRTLLSNLWYANQKNSSAPAGKVMDQADLFDVLQAIPQGLQTTLGENGRLISGGQGQRVRLARAMLQDDVRLVVLDEPFRGLDREKRSFLLKQTRQNWPNATMVCITHDVSQTEGFSRVLVIEDGRIVEDDTPENLKSRQKSRFKDLLEAEDAVRRTLWESANWKRLFISDGELKND